MFSVYTFPLPSSSFSHFLLSHLCHFSFFFLSSALLNSTCISFFMTLCRRFGWMCHHIVFKRFRALCTRSISYHNSLSIGLGTFLSLVLVKCQHAQCTSSEDNLQMDLFQDSRIGIYKLSMNQKRFGHLSSSGPISEKSCFDLSAIQSYCTNSLGVAGKQVYCLVAPRYVVAIDIKNDSLDRKLALQTHRTAIRINGYI